MDVCLVQSFQEQGYTLDRFELSRQEIFSKHGLYSARIRIYFVLGLFLIFLSLYSCDVIKKEKKTKGEFSTFYQIFS